MTKDELLWELNLAADRWRESKHGLKRFDEIMAECRNQCPLDQYPPDQCPIHGPVLDELDRRAVDMLAIEEFGT